MQTAKDFINRWHHIVTQQNMDGLDALLAENVVFSSPVVFTPIPGKELTKMYLITAGFTFNMEQFQYTREVHDGLHSVLEFETTIDDIAVNGVDMIEWTAEGKILDFKVMIRPRKAVEKVHEKMMSALEKQ